MVLGGTEVVQGGTWWYSTCTASSNISLAQSAPLNVKCRGTEWYRMIQSDTVW